MYYTYRGFVFGMDSLISGVMISWLAGLEYLVSLDTGSDECAGSHYIQVGSEMPPGPPL